MKKNHFASAAGGVVLAAALTLAVAPSASAATQVGSGGYTSLSGCQADQRQFAKSGYQIAQNCELRGDGLYHFTYWV
ncbi:hypothetical protein [Microbacterium azadirachtae]|uniref:hypothetical protein n=1 Tax=Microbacterium azadirachtae TaxID=582680 RepID=UPI00087F5B82|nr:hypothetical protein [Microbacterium azadirachtae]UXW85934.1 hypothetical protein NFX31_17295 [Microbacterium azadirachtae]SDL68433.1 hypothetical protein SAMN04488593_1569 [Microbacterium azadirachtae]SEF97819.1 hypothetical protein SAMN04488594_1556 [Microbacterium azadirachtae]SEG00239.1 hypothetical protein SAMN04488592_1566 [Microbacterium azadirachtae]